MIISKSGRKFKFGDGASVEAFQNAVIPAQVGNTKCNINTDVVEADIPLLLSKESLKRANAILNLSQDTITMFDKPVTLHYTSTGHYCVDIRQENIGNTQPEQAEVLVINDDMPDNKKKEILTKLHKQFGHASPEKLKMLIQNAGNTSEGVLSMLKNIVNDCDSCRRYKREKPKPAVGFPLASAFNETVAVDLHQLEKNLWYLHMIDEFTRFSAGAIITSKEPKVFEGIYQKLDWNFWKSQ